MSQQDVGQPWICTLHLSGRGHPEQLEMGIPMAHGHSQWPYIVDYDTLWYVVIRCDTLWYVVIRCDTLWYVMIRCDTLWYVLIRYDTLWYVVIRYDTLPVVPHKAVAEVSKIWNLKERLAVVNHGWQSEPIDGPKGDWSCVFWSGCNGCSGRLTTTAEYSLV